MANSASDLYTGKSGELYWKRNSIAPPARFERCRLLRNLVYGKAALQPWLELGCGQRWNMTSYDIGLDIDPRNRPHMVWDVRQGIPVTDQSFPVVFCVGLLMHLPWIGAYEIHGDAFPKNCKGAQFVLSEMARVAQRAVIIGEYVSAVENDLLWDYHNGSFGNGEPGLVWERPYAAPEGYELKKQAKLAPFGERPTFLAFERKDGGQ